MRVLLTIVLPLALPTALYLLWLRMARWYGATTRRATPWLWLAGAGVVLLAGVLVAVTVGFGTTEHGTYVPPEWRDGKIVPGHVVPDRKP